MNQFNLSAIQFAWLPIAPLIVVAVAAIVVLLVGVRVDDEESDGLGWLSIAALAIAFVLTLAMTGQNALTFSGALVVDDFTVFFELAILFAAGVVVLMSLSYADETRLPGAEYYSLILFAALGMMLMAAADDLIIIFLGLETMSLSIYVLAGLKRSDPRSNEAAFKYFLLGAFSTGFLLYGIALIYGATGTIKLEPIRVALSRGVALGNPLLLLGLAMMLIGFGFKIAAVPFHMWTPDAYEGAPTPITAYMATGVKLAAFAGFLRVFSLHLTAVSIQWSWVLWVVAALTMTVGNVVAVVQTNIKRMLAYSAIAHAGYLLVAMTAVVPQAGAAMLYYLLGYVFGNLGAFGVVTALERRGEAGDMISDYRGLAQRQPGLAAAMAIFLFSLTGVPPLVGFLGKFYVFSAALAAGLVWLVVIAVLNSVMAAYYYIYVIVAMYMQEGGVAVARVSARPGLVAAIAIALIGTILIGIYPQPYMAAATTAFNSALGLGPIHAASLLP
ncbi:MAG TPA: NADH-quinone oxidoreductase subunit N [Candidatus Binataceae bacterium]|nr:NADH-quinone oxidoreductase subunit N [Candidatus Binataceae bacterium]